MGETNTVRLARVRRNYTTHTRNANLWPSWRRIKGPPHVMEHARLGAWGLVISMPTRGQAQEESPMCIAEYLLPLKKPLGKNLL